MNTNSIKTVCPKNPTTPTTPTNSAAGPTGSAWEITPELVTAPDATLLRRAYYAEVAGRYWKRSVTEAEIDEGLEDFPDDGLLPPTGQFVVGRLGGEPLACGGIRLLALVTAELTKVYVDPRARGTGGGAALLEALEEAGRALGAERVRLDTRSDLVEARALYARHGYAEIPAYKSGPYAEHWFEKPLV
ncbi:GNAT family N-acetyltransferase [Streptomyces sp. NPDC051183]|uniref:GNAT family N-acetyltransferase n=1 Tax=Streptomyces sp. NPDC051183 TaxID=3155165 RepID=UPI003445CBEA